MFQQNKVLGVKSLDQRICTVSLVISTGLFFQKVVPVYILANYRQEPFNKPCWSECWLFVWRCIPTTERFINVEIRPKAGDGQGGRAVGGLGGQLLELWVQTGLCRETPKDSSVLASADHSSPKQVYGNLMMSCISQEHL